MSCWQLIGGIPEPEYFRKGDKCLLKNKSYAPEDILAFEARVARRRIVEEGSIPSVSEYHCESNASIESASTRCCTCVGIGIPADGGVQIVRVLQKLVLPAQADLWNYHDITIDLPSIGRLCSKAVNHTARIPPRGGHIQRLCTGFRHRVDSEHRILEACEWTECPVAPLQIIASGDHRIELPSPW